MSNETNPTVNPAHIDEGEHDAGKDVRDVRALPSQANQGDRNEGLQAEIGLDLSEVDPGYIGSVQRPAVGKEHTSVRARTMNPEGSRLSPDISRTDERDTPPSVARHAEMHARTTTALQKISHTLIIRAHVLAESTDAPRSEDADHVKDETAAFESDALKRPHILRPKTWHLVRGMLPGRRKDGNDLPAPHDTATAHEQEGAEIEDGHDSYGLAREAVEATKAQFSSFREALQHDSELKAALNEAFIARELRPVVDGIKAKGHISDEDAALYIKILSDQLADNIRPQDEPEYPDRPQWKDRQEQVLQIRGRVEDYSDNILLNDLATTLKIAPSFGKSQGDYYDEAISVIIAREEYAALTQLAADVNEADIPDYEKSRLTTVITRGLFEPAGVEDLIGDDVDFVRWQLLKDNPDAQAYFGESTLQEVENASFGKVLQAVVTNTDREKKYDLTKTLLRFRTGEAAPLVVLNCWREAGYNRTYPFLSKLDTGGTEVSNYIASLPDEELAKLQNQQIPGIVEAIQLIKDNPDTFQTPKVVETRTGPQFEAFVKVYAETFHVPEEQAAAEVREGGKQLVGWDPQTSVEFLLERRPEFELQEILAENREIDNPVFVELNNNLIKASTHLLLEGNEEEQVFAVGMFGSKKIPFTDEGSAALNAFLQSSDDSDLQMQMVTGLMERYEAEPAEAVLRFYTDLHPDVQADVKKNIRVYLAQILEKKPTLDTEALASVTLALDRDEADVAKVMDLLANNSLVKLSFSADEVDDYIAIVSSPETMDTITELKQYGFTLSADHFAALPSVVQERESIVAKIREIREVDPDYNYNFAVARNENNEPVLKTDPYDSFIDYSRNTYLNDLARIQERHGRLRQEFSDAALRYVWNGDTQSISAEQYAAFHQHIAFLAGHQDGSLSASADRELGGLVMHMSQYESSRLLLDAGVKNVNAAEKTLKESGDITLTPENWEQMLILYIRSQDGLGNLQEGRPNPQLTEKIRGLFEDSKNKDFCLEQANKAWQEYLKGGQVDAMPYSLQTISRMIEYTGGAGTLGQLESLQKFTQKVGISLANPELPDATKQVILEGLSDTEARFISEKWSNAQRTDFYDISSDIINADPELFADYFDVFSQLGPADMKRFSKEIYPYYRAQIVLLEKRGEPHSAADIADLRADIQAFSSQIGPVTEGAVFDAQKEKLTQKTRELFQARFGITKLPEEFTSEHIRSLNNFTLYLANMSSRTPERENILGFYLALKMNGTWDAFRRGEIVDAADYMVPEKSREIEELVKRRAELSPVTAENIGISADDLPEFQRLLQQETQNVVIGNIETIDVKLTNVILNLRTITDMDLYPEPLDRKRMELLVQWGNKKIGSVVSKMYQQAANPERQVKFSQDDEVIRGQIRQIMEETDGLDPTDPNALKQHFQVGMRPLATGVNLLNFIDQSGAEEEMFMLQERLVPSTSVVDVFQRLGEDFKPTSGAFALSQDLTYLDTLVVKREDELKPGEKDLLTAYTASIREQVVKLEGIYGKIAEKFTAMRQGSQGSGNELLEAKLADIDRIINAQSTQQAITSTVTEDMNAIIENMRECLSCSKQGANNDTNLTYGESNKFYIYSNTETQKNGSIADEVVFFEPVTRADGSTEMAFVFDRLYGTNTPTILGNQVETVLKKARAIKSRFPDAKISLFVSGAALQTGGSSTELFINDMQSKDIQAQPETVNVNVSASAFADHYVEFGGEFRGSGPREVKGITIGV